MDLFDNDRPIYVQIVESVEQNIVTGKYKCGDKLPTVRELASEYKINPNTVQRSFTELESLGIVKSEGTVGRYVTDDRKIINNLKKNIIHEKIGNFMKDMETLDISVEETIEFIKSKGERS